MAVGSPIPAGNDEVLAARAERLAARLLARSDEGQGRRQRSQHARVARLLDDDEGVAFTLALTDEVLRIRDPRRAARHLRSVVAELGSPRFLGRSDRLLLRAGTAAAAALPRVVMPLVAARLRAELAGYVIAAEPGPLGRHIARRRAEDIRLNLNVLGEAVLGEQEATHRLDAVLALLARPDVDYVSVKVSSVCAQLNAAAFDDEVARVAGRLRRLYDAALAAQPHKFVNLDMEEYRDLDLTVAVFRSVLSEPAYAGLDAGIVLQAYIPDSLPALEEIAAWARDRRRRGGGRVKVRIVKGANLAMEQVEAELAGWAQAPFTSKGEVDANYKRMLDAALVPANAGALRVGVASHNLFELAWALTVAAERGVGAMVEAEMLEGMAGSAAAPVRDAAGGLLLYAPIVARADHESAIAYLVRRFDENTGPDNFLRNQFSMTVGSPAWEAERDRFLAAVTARHLPAVPSRRTQDRSQPAPAPLPGAFANAADTDLAVAANRSWLTRHLAEVPWDDGAVIPAVVDGHELVEPATGEGRDPSAPRAVAYRWVQAPVEVAERAVAAAVAGQEAWRKTDRQARRDILLGVAAELEARRGPLISVMARDGGKTYAQADPEVSEAVDFARYYASCLDAFDPLEGRGTTMQPFGTVAVVPPWNFPLAIPAGGVLAALAAGNTVILKPAPETVAVAHALAEACWAGGVPRAALQFVPCADDDAGRRLVTHPDVDAVVLTGAWETARMFLEWRPDLRLRAETSGKNAVVVTATADLDHAVADLVGSAFGHAGQKCSAASLAIVEASVYDDPQFRRQLADAARSLRPGPAWDPTTDIGPLIRPPQPPLSGALSHLDDGESWLLRPEQVGPDQYLWTPGIKLGVRPGSAFHLTECFGPVLGVMRADHLDEAIAWQNQPAYGLTAGLHSLDPAEIARWLERVEAGNLYVNRHITGAIVRRQPFGGWKRSVVGPGAKAGGPNYVASLGSWQGGFEGDAAGFAAAVAAALRTELGPTDDSNLVSEANVLRYRPLRRVVVRAGASVDDRSLDLAVAAGRAVGVEVQVSVPVPRQFAGAVVEDDGTLASRLSGGGWDKLRLVGATTDGLRLGAHDAGVWVDETPVVADARLEALRWVREQAVSVTRHRHGNLTGRYDGVIAAL
jgi:RHH-type proline utilization regulon transcriptional repressor/proline dehydrogenase/delta 1-pyrroline-5-carboxylate dehydrogenase